MGWCAQKTEENEKRGRKNSKKNLTEPTFLEMPVASFGYNFRIPNNYWPIVMRTEVTSFQVYNFKVRAQIGTSNVEN